MERSASETRGMILVTFLFPEPTSPVAMSASTGQVARHIIIVWGGYKVGLVVRYNKGIVRDNIRTVTCSAIRVLSIPWPFNYEITRDNYLSPDTFSEFVGYWDILVAVDLSHKRSGPVRAISQICEPDRIIPHFPYLKRHR